MWIPARVGPPCPKANWVPSGLQATRLGDFGSIGLAATHRHRLVKSNGQRETVANVALGLGFTNLSRFAKQYQSMFGELPSATLSSQH